MAKIKNILESIGIISKEVRKMVDNDYENKDGLCVECDRPTTHAGAYFCDECAPEFYNERKDEREGEE